MKFNKSVNNIYLNNSVLDKIKKSYIKSDPNKIILRGFLKDGIYQQIYSKLKKQKIEQIKIPDRFSFKKHNLLSEVKDIFNNKEFREFLSIIIGKEVKKINLETREYGWKDYTLLHDSEAVGKRIEFFFIFAPNWDDFYGGSKIYEKKGKAFVFSPIGNSFCLINKKKDVLGFLQYINNYAGSQSILLVEGWI